MEQFNNSKKLYGGYWNICESLNLKCSIYTQQFYTVSSTLISLTVLIRNLQRNGLRRDSNTTNSRESWQTLKFSDLQHYNSLQNGKTEANQTLRSYTLRHLSSVDCSQT